MQGAFRQGCWPHIIRYGPGRKTVLVGRVVRIFLNERFPQQAELLKQVIVMVVLFAVLESLSQAPVLLNRAKIISFFGFL